MKMNTKVLEEIKDYSIKKYEAGNRVKVHVSKIDYPENQKYDTVCGVYINSELTNTYELTNISNKEIDDFTKKLTKLIRSKTLFLI